MAETGKVDSVGEAIHTVLREAAATARALSQFGAKEEQQEQLGNSCREIMSSAEVIQTTLMNSALAEGAAKAPDGADYEARHISVLLLLQARLLTENAQESVHLAKQLLDRI